MPELRFAKARVVRKEEGPSKGPPPLHKVSFHLQAALQEIRELPVSTLSREEYHTWIYHLASAALKLVVEDNLNPIPDTEPEQPDAEELRSDLKDILG